MRSDGKRRKLAAMTLSLPIEQAQTEGFPSPCAGDPGPWQDTESLAKQRQAAGICQSRCGYVDWCERERLRVADDFGPGAIGGVWAGVIYGTEGHPRVHQ